MSAPVTSTQVINVFRYTALALGFYTGVTNLADIKARASVRDEILAKQHLIKQAKEEYAKTTAAPVEKVTTAVEPVEELSLEALLDKKDFDLAAYLEEKVEKL
ncbi:hypothetical protein ACO0SA_000665 [Hanseniaspora valbyensis]